LITAVKEDSVADLTGITEEDEIIEINGKNAASLSGDEVLGILHPLSCPLEVNLLVIEEEDKTYFVEHGIKISSQMDVVLHMKTPSWALKYIPADVKDKRKVSCCSDDPLTLSVSLCSLCNDDLELIFIVST